MNTPSQTAHNQGLTTQLRTQIAGQLLANDNGQPCPNLQVTAMLQGYGGAQKLTTVRADSSGRFQLVVDTPPPQYGEQQSIFLDVADLTGQLVGRSEGIVPLHDKVVQARVVVKCVGSASTTTGIATPHLQGPFSPAALPGSQTPEAEPDLTVAWHPVDAGPPHQIGTPEFLGKCPVGSVLLPNGKCCKTKCPSNSKINDPCGAAGQYNGCGGKCGCTAPLVCFNNRCCKPKACDGNIGSPCGTDGCGGTCPPCKSAHCINGKCCLPKCPTDGSCGKLDSCGYEICGCPPNQQCKNGKCQACGNGVADPYGTPCKTDCDCPSPQDSASTSCCGWQCIPAGTDSQGKAFTNWIPFDPGMEEAVGCDMTKKRQVCAKPGQCEVA